MESQVKKISLENIANKKQSDETNQELLKQYDT